VISVSIGADVRKIFRRLVHFEHPRHDETRRYVTKECKKVKGATYPYRGVGGVLISLP